MNLPTYLLYPTCPNTKSSSHTAQKKKQPCLVSLSQPIHLSHPFSPTRTSESNQTLARLQKPHKPNSRSSSTRGPKQLSHHQRRNHHQPCPLSPKQDETDVAVMNGVSFLMHFVCPGDVIAPAHAPHYVLIVVKYKQTQTHITPFPPFPRYTLPSSTRAPFSTHRIYLPQNRIQKRKQSN